MLNLNLGCGPCHLPNFINIDHSAHWKPDICMDYLRLSDQFEVGSVDNIITIHSIEHLAWPNGVLTFMVQVFRVLKPGGVLRVVVPDLMKVSRKYVAGEDLRDIYGGEHFYAIDCPATRFLYFCREWQHTIVFDEQLLGLIMRGAGFENVRVMPFGDSDALILRGIDRYEPESLCMEGTKP